MAGTKDLTPDDPDDLDGLRSHVVRLAHLTLNQLESDLTRGSVNQRLAAQRMIAPYLLKSLDSKDEDDANEELRQSVADLMAEVRGESTPD